MKTWKRFKGTNKSLWAVTERRKQEFHCTVTTSLTDSLLFILAFSVRLPNHERLSETFWLHVAFLHHHFSFYFTWTFLSFHFCLIIRILLSQTRDSHKERTKHAEDGLQGSLFDSNEYWECGFGCVRWWSMETGRGCLGYWVTEEDAARNEGLRGILQQMEKKMLVG